MRIAMKAVKWGIIGSLSGVAWWLLSLIVLIINRELADFLFGAVNKPLTQLFSPVIRSIAPADHILNVVFLMTLCYAFAGFVVGELFLAVKTVIRLLIKLS